MANRPLPLLLINRIKRILNRDIVGATSTDVPNVVLVDLGDGEITKVNLATNQEMTEQNPTGRKGAFETLISRKSFNLVDKKKSAEEKETEETESIKEEKPKKATVKKPAAKTTAKQKSKK